LDEDALVEERNWNPTFSRRNSLRYDDHGEAAGITTKRRRNTSKIRRSAGAAKALSGKYARIE
jgi:hypothetical protein